MTFVEWLRVRNTLKWTAIVLAVIVVLLVVAELFVLNDSAHELSQVDFGTANGKDVDVATIVKGSTTTYATLPDGTHRTILDNAQYGVHITIDDHGYWGKHIEVYERFVRRPHKTIDFGPLHFERTPRPTGSMLAIDTNRPEDFAYYAAIAAFVALVVATILGAPFARENDGHLEVALTKPRSRVELGVGTILVDLAGIAGAWIMTVIALFVAHSLTQAPSYIYNPADAAVIVLGLAGAAAWYAMLCAATASMKRAYGTVLGIAWPAALLVLFFAHADLGGSAIVRVLRWLATPLSWIDPFNYMHFGPAFTVNGHPAGSMAVSLYSELPALVILALVYGALAIVQWRRVEA